MSYDDFIDHRNKLGNLWNVVRKKDGKCVLRGGNYNSVLNLISDKEHKYKYFVW